MGDFPIKMRRVRENQPRQMFIIALRTLNQMNFACLKKPNMPSRRDMNCFISSAMVVWA
jgi:hypothetical protein